MDKKLKTKWIKALRSGKYKQGSGRLKKGNTYCCLGVLAAIQGAKFVEGEPVVKGKYVGQKNATGSFLSPSFCGLKASTQSVLARYNDGELSTFAGKKIPGTKKSFAEIADYIEKRL